MAVELIFLAAGAAIALVVMLTVMSVGWEIARSWNARTDLSTAVAIGAQPASLHPRIDPTRCIGSGNCVRACPEADVLAVLDGQAHVVNPTSCIGHGECMRACPVDAISLVLGSERRGVDIPLVDKDFQTNVDGLFIVGELGGMGLIYNAVTQGLQCMRSLIADLPPPVEGVHQVVIVGAGPAGMACSLAAIEAGLDYVTLDQDTLGGTVLHYPRHKLVMTRPVVLPLYGTLDAREIQKEDLLAIWRDVVERTGLTIRGQTRVTRVQSQGTDSFRVEIEDGPPLSAQRVVLAMGRRGTPRKLGVPGESLPKVVYRLLDPEQYEGRRCLVVGGGDSALEAAVALADVGARVTLSYRKAQLTRAKKKNRQRIQSKIDAELVDFLPQSTVLSITTDSVALGMGGREKFITNDYVFVFAGGLLPTRFLADSGVEVATFTGQVYAPANPGTAAVEPGRRVSPKPSLMAATPLPARFAIHECLGKGAFGEVYRATYLAPQKPEQVVALKLLRKELAFESEPLVRLRDEARLLMRLRNPGIVRVAGLVELDGRVALVSEFVDGLELNVLRARNVLPERTSVEIVARIGAALHAAWTTPGDSGKPMRLVHRDIKPGNVMVSRTGDVKLLDFGIARADIDREASTETGAVMGTFQYMAPESFHGRAGAPADVFALGCVLFQMLAGRRYIRSPNLPAHYGVLVDEERYEARKKEELDRLTGSIHALTLNLLARTLNHVPDERPRTEDLVTMFGQLLGRIEGPSLRRWARDVDFARTTKEGDLTGSELLLERSIEV